MHEPAVLLRTRCIELGPVYSSLLLRMDFSIGVPYLDGIVSISDGRLTQTRSSSVELRVRSACVNFAFFAVRIPLRRNSEIHEFACHISSIS